LFVVNRLIGRFGIGMALDGAAGTGGSWAFLLISGSRRR